ncbi:MAG: cellulase family glycosylhydrolase [Bacteroidetes bacterium]|nr:cellulase family glycosylhydrolase [Bacteroidota bacterium]
MKIKNYPIFLLFTLVMAASTLQAQLGTTISVNGNLILGPCGDTLLLRGVNYAPFNWGWSPNQLFMDEIAQSGSNCVRLPWYRTPAQGTPQTTYSDLANLDSALSKCIQYQLIPILELHDLTCQNDTTALVATSNWYLEPALLALIDKYKHSIILNVANEALYVNWTGNPAASQATFVRTYSEIVTNFRNAGITVPIMIDGPDCGSNLDVLAAVGPTMQLNDPAQNLIFSAHAYWYAFANNDSTQMEAKIDNAIASGIPFVMGEVANLQDDQVLCQYTLNYSALLHILQARNIGWLAWSWDNDGCADRQITTNGSFSSLTAYGNDILYNIDYGIYNFAPARSAYLFNGGFCNPVIARDEAQAAATLKLVPNPSNGKFDILFNHSFLLVKVEVFNAAGQLVHLSSEAQATRIHLDFEGPAGIYNVKISTDAGDVRVLKLVKI